MAFKTFVNGVNLPASDVNDYLMKQSVMTFASSAARASALTVPTEGMTTYLQDTNQVEIYDGSVWRPEAGLALVHSNDYSGASSYTISNVFSSTYRDYKIVLENVQGATVVSPRLAQGGIPNMSGSYAYNGRVHDNSTGYNSFSSGSTSWDWVAYGASPTFGAAEMELRNPQTTAIKRIFVRGAYLASYLDQRHILYTGAMNSTLQFDGINFFGSANFSMNVKIYGYRNA